jgi:hypothetical protein
MGDGVLAYFGYPRADEHDAERAVRAGLALVGAVPRLDTAAEARLQVRVGIATGLVVVGDLIGEGAAQEQAVVGETPNLQIALGRALVTSFTNLGVPELAEVSSRLRELSSTLNRPRALLSILWSQYADHKARGPSRSTPDPRRIPRS